MTGGDSFGGRRTSRAFSFSSMTRRACAIDSFDLNLTLSMRSIRWELSTGGTERLPFAAEGACTGDHGTGSQFLDQANCGQGRESRSSQENCTQFSHRQLEIGVGLRAFTRDRIASGLQPITPAVPWTKGILDLEDHVQ